MKEGFGVDQEIYTTPKGVNLRAKKKRHLCNQKEVAFHVKVVVEVLRADLSGVRGSEYY